MTINNNQKIEPGFLDMMNDQMVQSSLLSHDAKGDPVWPKLRATGLLLGLPISFHQGHLDGVLDETSVSFLLPVHSVLGAIWCFLLSAV